MTDEKSLIPFLSDDEIREILAQTIKENRSNYPVVVMQIELARMMVTFIDKLKESLVESVKELEATIYRKS